jgi:hypothetical protein
MQEGGADPIFSTMPWSQYRAFDARVRASSTPGAYFLRDQTPRYIGDLGTFVNAATMRQGWRLPDEATTR